MKRPTKAALSERGYNFGDVGEAAPVRVSFRILRVFKALQGGKFPPRLPSRPIFL
jgi:hypothetical protein